MPAPTSAAEFLVLTQKSGLAGAESLASYRQMAATEVAGDQIARMVRALVHDGVLTRFQAEQLLKGKWKGFRIGRYKVLDRLGSGGVGQVFLCEHEHMRRRMAIKVLLPHVAASPRAVERFYREARAAAALDHPNIVRAYDIDADGDLHYFAMEYVEGTSLQQMVDKNGPLEVHLACRYVRDTAAGLQFALDAGLIHRDIKPCNIMVDRHRTLKLLDLGLARFINDEDDVLTERDHVLGTVDYLAPEQARDSHSVDTRADIYSLGATLYFLLTGKPPFAGGSYAEKMIRRQMEEPGSIRLLRPDVSEAIDGIVQRMMRIRPQQRFQTPQEVVTALTPFAKETPQPHTVSTKPNPRTEQRRSPSQPMRPAQPDVAISWWTRSVHRCRRLLQSLKRRRV